jgi:putative ABC transport system permease protein
LCELSGSGGVLNVVTLVSEIRQVVRRLMRSPMFTLVTLFTIAIGVGANSAVFSVVSGVLLKPLPYPEPGALIGVWQTSTRLNIKDLNASPSDYFTFREENRTFQAFGLWNGGSVAVTGQAAPEQVQCLVMTEGTLNALGVSPLLGRWFTPEDDKPTAPETAIFTYGYWQRKFGGNPAAVGSQLVVDGKLTSITGVMPQSFRFLDQKAELILPMRFDRAKLHLGNFSFQGLARLKPGVTLAQANADVARMIPMVNRKFTPPPGFSVKLFEEAGIQAAVRPLKDDVVGDLGKVLWVLMGSIGVVLLIACANVANLLLVRAEGRQLELATRMALGAGSRRIAASLLTESVLLGVLGGTLGLGVAYVALRVLVAIAPAYLPRLENISLDPLVIAFTLGISVVAGILFGLIPVFKYAAPKGNAALRGGGRSLSHSKERHRARNTLVVVQTALAVVLLISAGLMIRTFQALRHVHPGFTGLSQLQTFRIDIASGQVKEPERVLRMQQEIRRKLAEIPGVTSVSYANSVPTDGNNSTDVLYAEDRVYAEGQVPPLRRFKFVTPDFFQTMGTPLIAGRDLTWTDVEQRRNVAMVSENFARELWLSPAAALGKRIREGAKDEWREIIGVVGDVRHDGADQKAPATIYWPVAMSNFWGNEKFLQRRSVYAIRTDRAGSESMMTQMRQVVWSVVPDVPIVSVRTMEEVYRGSMARSSFTLVMLGIAGGMALLLGIVGIYGVVSYSVSQRTRELGIRIALGAGNGEVRGMVVRQGVLLAGIGIAVGLAVAFAVTRIMSSLLFETSSMDPITYAAASAGLLGAAAIASYLPAHRASSVNPVEALRME